MSEELKPCPFCGGEASIACGSVMSLSRWIECEVCQAEGPLEESNESAIGAWNRRVESTEKEQLAFIRQVIEICEEVGIEPEFSSDSGEIKIYIRCNDIFYWGCSDAEEVRIENLSILRQSAKDIPNWKAGYLFCARVRGLRPQGAFYEAKDDKKDWPLFDACGPEREICMGNPYRPGEYRSKP